MDRVAIYMLNTHGGARQTPKITTAQISIVASVVNLIMVTLAHILVIRKLNLLCNIDYDTKKKLHYFYCRWIKDSLPNQWLYVFLYSVSGENISRLYSNMIKVVGKLLQIYSLFLWYSKCDPN